MIFINLENSLLNSNIMHQEVLISFMVKITPTTRKKPNPLRASLQTCLLLLPADSVLMREKRVEKFDSEYLTSF